MPDDKPRDLTLTPAQQRSRRARNVAVALVITALVLLVYALTIAKLGGHVGGRGP